MHMTETRAAGPLFDALPRWGAGLLLLSLAALPFDGALVPLLIPPAGWGVDGVLVAIHGFGPRVLLTIGTVAAILAWAWGRSADRRRSGLLIVVSLLGATLATSLLKALVGRPRPQLAGTGAEPLRVILPLADNASFPSGHTVTTTVFAVAMALFIGRGRARWLLLGLVPVMMWDRMGLGHHHLSDVLAGAALGVLAVWAVRGLLAGRDVTVPRSFRPLAALLLLLLLSWYWKDPAIARDPVTLEPAVVEGLVLRPQALRLVFEPLLGPPLQVALFDEPLLTAISAAAWFGVLLLALALLPRGTPWPRRLARTGWVALLGGAWCLLLLAGIAPADRFVSRDRPGIFVDLHVHESADGGDSLAVILGRFERRGVDVIAVTDHDRLVPGSGHLAGAEWSGGDHPRTRAPHLLLIGDAVGIAAALREADPLAAVRVARAGGALVIVAHACRSRRALEAEGSRMPTTDEFVAAGADGFEVGNRAPDGDPELRAALVRLREACEAAGLLQVANSDDHALPIGSPCVTFLPGEFPTDPPARRTAVLARLRDRGPVVPLAFVPAAVGCDAGAVLRGPLLAWSYFAGLTPMGRLAWLFWGAAACALAALVRRRAGAPTGSPRGSRGSGPRSSPR